MDVDLKLGLGIGIGTNSGLTWDWRIKLEWFEDWLFQVSFLVFQFINGLNLVSHDKPKIKGLKYDDFITLNETMVSLSPILIDKGIVS